MRSGSISVKYETAGFIAALAVFAVMMYLVVSGSSQVWDESVSAAFYSIRSKALTAVAVPVTYLGSWQSIVAICLVLLIIKRTRTAYGVPVAVAALSTTILRKIIKAIVKRPRPDDIYHLVNEGGYSFVSGHSITSIAVFGILIFLVRSRMENRIAANVLTVILVIPMVTIGLSRIYLGVHYPTDVVGGWSLGVAVIFLEMIIIKKRSLRKERLPYFDK